MPFFLWKWLMSTDLIRNTLGGNAVWSRWKNAGKNAGKFGEKCGKMWKNADHKPPPLRESSRVPFTGLGSLRQNRRQMIPFFLFLKWQKVWVQKGFFFYFFPPLQITKLQKGGGESMGGETPPKVCIILNSWSITGEFSFCFKKMMYFFWGGQKTYFWKLNGNQRNFFFKKKKKKTASNKVIPSMEPDRVDAAFGPPSVSARHGSPSAECRVCGA